MKQKLSHRRQLEIAFGLVTRHFLGKRDRGGHSILEHLIRIAGQSRTTKEMIVALLHEILEDTALKRDDLLRYGFSLEIVEAIESVTRREGESRVEAAQRARRNTIGRRVKRRDVNDNLNLKRLKKITAKDIERMEEYRDVFNILNG